MNFKQAVGSENIYGVFKCFCISVVQNLLFTSLQISDEPYLFLRIITLFTSLTNQSSPLQGEIEGGGNIFPTDKYNAFLPARVGIL